MKTKMEWDNSGKCLSEFLQVGDTIDEEMVDYFIGVLPPRCMSAQCIQIGEPYSCNADGATFATLIKRDGSWQYAGNINTPKDEICLCHF